MAIAIASTSTASANDSTSVTVTAPTSIATDDLLVIVATCGGNITHTSTGFTQAYTHYYNGPSAGQSGRITVLYKKAVLADESEANYTVTGDLSNRMGGVAMFRVTGFSPETDPVFDYAVGNVSIPDADVTVNDSVSISRPTQGASFIAATMYDNDSFTGEILYQNFQITSTDSNPTWTTLDVDDNFQTGDGSNYYGSFSMGYATSSDTSAISAYGFDYNVTSLDEAARGIYTLFTILTPANASGGNTLLTTTGTLFTATGATGGSGGNTLLTTTGTLFSQTGSGTSPTQWTNEAKPSTTWVNEQK